MSDRAFLDSNILVYSIDERDKRKQDIARELIIGLINKNSCHISTQVLQEFYNVATKKLACTKENAKQFVEQFANAFSIYINEPKDIIEGINVSIKTGFSFWDSLVLTSAHNSLCTVLYSEDLNAGQIVNGVKIINPFQDA